jgi:hypothetical protein
VQVASGTLLLTGGGSAAGSIAGAGAVEFAGGGASYAETGTYNVAGGTLVRRAAVNFLPGAKVQAVGPLTITGGGSANFSDGATINTPSLVLANSDNSGGGILTGSDTVNVSGLTRWVDGTMSGKGSTNASGGLILGANDGAHHGQVLDARTFNNAGSASWFGLFGDIFVSQHGSAFNNLAGATFAIPNGNGLTWKNGTGDSSFNNAGAMTVSTGTGSTEFDVAFSNSGSVQVQAGTLFLANGTSATGSFASAAGATLELSSNVTLAAKSSVSGAGAVAIIGGVTDVAAGATYNLTGLTAISAGVVRFDANATLGSLALSGGNLGGASTVTVKGAIVWTGGTMSGPGTTLADGGLQLGSSTGAADTENLNARTLQNAGTLTWLANNTFEQEHGSTFDNLAAGTIDLQNHGTWINNDGTALLVNNGTLTKSAGSGKSLVGINFDNAGTVTVQTGTLDFNAGGTASGSFTVAAGATLVFDGPNTFTFQASSSIHGAGTVVKNFGSNVPVTLINTNVSGTVTIPNGSLVDFEGNIHIGGLSMAGGAITGAGTVTVDGPAVWTGGTMNGPGTLIAAGGLQLGDANNHSESLFGRTLINTKTAVWAFGNNLFQGDSSTFVNQAGATLDFQSAGAWQTDSTTMLTNAGTLMVEAGSANTLEIDATVNSTGAVQVNSGTLYLNGGGNEAGSVSGAGAMQFGGGGSSVFTIAGTYNVAGGTQVQGGDVTFVPGAHVQAVGPLALNNNGVLNLNDGATINTPSLQILNNAILTGSDNITVTGMTTWVDGGITGSGSLNATGGLVLGASDGNGHNETLAGRTINNSGAGQWLSQSGTVFASAGSAFNNLAGATFAIPNGMQLQWRNDDNTVAINNAGTFTVAAGTGGTTELDPTFTNQSKGSLTISSGTLFLNGGGSDAGSISGAGTLEFGGSGSSTFTEAGNYNVTGATQVQYLTLNFTASAHVQAVGALLVNHNGTMNLSDGATINTPSLQILDNATLTGSDTVNVSGLTTWLQGTMSGSGVTNANGGLVLGANDSNSHSEVLASRTLNNAGKAQWLSQMGTVYTNNGSVFNNLAGATFDIPEGMQLQWTSDNGNSTFNNAGAMTVAAGTGGVTEIDAAFNDRAKGSVQVNSGTLFLNGGGSDAGRIGGAGTLEFGGPGGGTFTEAGSYNVTGGTQVQYLTLSFTAAAHVQAVGALVVNHGGTMDLSDGATVTVPSLQILDNGTLTGSDTVTVSGLTTWLQGTMSGMGTTNANGGLVIGANDTNNHSEALAGRTLNNAGKAQWLTQTGTVYTSGASTFNNLAGATFDVPEGMQLQWSNDDSNSTFNNAGTMTVAAGTGTTEIDAAFNNQGTGSLQVNSGTLFLNGGGSGAGSIRGAGTLEFGGPGGSTFTESGTYNVTGATQVQFITLDFTSSAHVQAVGALTVNHNGTVNLSDGSAVAVPSLQILDNGTLTGSDTVTVSGPITWLQGTMSGTGVTNASGGLIIGANDGTNYNEALASRTLNNAGAAQWLSQFGTVFSSNGAVFNNLAGATLDVPEALQLQWTNDNGNSTFNNAGTITVEAGSGGVTEIDPAFTNAAGGSIKVNSGTLFLNGGGSAVGTIGGAGALEFGGSGIFTESGTYNVAGGTRIQFGTVNFMPGSHVRAVGPLTVDQGGTANLNDGATVTTPSLQLLNDGILTGADTVTVSGMTTWAQGTMSGSGVTNAQGGLVIGADDGTTHDQALDARTVNNAGAAQWLGQDATVFARNGSTFNNLAGATLDIPDGAQMLWTNDDGNSTFNNAGALTIDARGGTTEFDVAFNDQAGSSVLVPSGTFFLKGGGSAAGSFEGAGALEFGGSASTIFTDTGPYNIAGGTQVQSATVNFLPGAQLQAVGPLLVNQGGTANFSAGAAINTPSLDLLGGSTLTGSDTVSVSGRTNWTDSTMSGKGVTNANGGLVLGASDGNVHNETLDARTINNGGAAVWESQPGGHLFASSDSTFNNLAGSICAITNGAGLTWTNDPGNTINNAGTLTINAAGGTAEIDAALNNTGTLDLLAGTLLLSGGGTRGGKFDVAPGASLLFNANSQPATPPPIPTTVPAGANGSTVSAIQVGTVTQTEVFSQSISSQAAQQLYAFNIPAGQTLQFTVDAAPGSGFDSALRLFDVNGNQLVITSPITLVSGQANFSFRFDTAGTYFLGVSGYPNLTYNPLTGAGAVPGSTGSYTLTVVPNPAAPTSPHGQIHDATSLGSAAQVRLLSNFWISSATDVDMFRFSVAAHREITITIGRPAGSNLVAVLRLFDGHGHQLASSTGPDATLTYTFRAGGTYYVGVSGRGNASYSAVTGAGTTPGSTGSYTIALFPGAGKHSRLDAATSIGNVAHTTRTGALSAAHPLDLFSFTVASGQQIAFTVTGSGGLNPYLRLFDGNGVELANSGSSGRLTFTFLLGGTYYLGVSARGAAAYDAVTGAGTAGNSRGAYRLSALSQGMQPTPFRAGLGAAPTLFSYDSSAAAVGGTVLFDQSGIGQLTTSAVGESGHMVFLDRNNNGIRDDGEPATFTNAQGQFLLDVPRANRSPVFAAPMLQLGIPIEKVTDPHLGYYNVQLAPSKAVVHLVFGLARYEG